MRYSRAGVVAVLLAAEVFIGAAIVWTLRGGHGWTLQASGLHHISRQGKAYPPIEAGMSPHVVIDDPDSRIVITPSTDGKVHVTDGWRASGWVFGRDRTVPLRISTIPGGVSIQRSGDWFHIGFLVDDSHRTLVALPPHSQLDVRHCGGADASGLTGAVAIHSDDGSISLSGIHATGVNLVSRDGSLRLDDVQAPAIEARTSDGSIRAEKLQVGGGHLRSADGSIRVALLQPNLRIHAHSDDGSIRVDGRRVGDLGDSSASDYRFGTGGGSLKLSTQDGSIHITTNGAL